MSLFDGRQPAMFDVRKRIGNVERSNDEFESTATESWVELAPSRGSLCSSVDAMVLVDADSSVKGDSRQSPISLQSPIVEFESNLEQVKYSLAKDMLPSGRNVDWIWDWSSRPETLPPKNVRLRSGHIGSTLSTPPNSPEPERSSFHERERRNSLFGFDVIFSLVFTNLITFFVGALLGFCVCKVLGRGEREF